MVRCKTLGSACNAGLYGSDEACAGWHLELVSPLRCSVSPGEASTPSRRDIANGLCGCAEVERMATSGIRNQCHQVPRSYSSRTSFRLWFTIEIDFDQVFTTGRTQSDLNRRKMRGKDEVEDTDGESVGDTEDDLSSCSDGDKSKTSTKSLLDVPRADICSASTADTGPQGTPIRL